MSRIVYVGRIPFDLTEEQLEDIFKSVGPVENTRLMFDRATGKSKGFAFIQYYNPESAASAIRNLDNYKVGNMRLKVNYSSGSFQSRPQQGAEPTRANEESEAGSIPDIVNSVTSLNMQDKRAIIKEIQKMITVDSQKTAAFLTENPQLSYALVQSMFELNLIDGKNTSQLIVSPVSQSSKSVSTPPPAMPQVPQFSQQQPTMALPPMPPMSMQPPVAQVPQNMQNPQLQQQLPQQFVMGQPHNVPGQMNSNQVSTTSVSQPQSYMQQQQQPNSSLQPQMTFQFDEGQKQFFRQIMELTNDQLNSMPSEQRDAALQIRNQIQSGVIVL